MSVSTGVPERVQREEERLGGVGDERRRKTMARLTREYAILVLFVVLFGYLAFSAANFLTVDNLKNLLTQSTTIGIMACAGTLVIVAGSFDLSVGAVFTLTSIVTVLVANSVSVPVGIGAGVLAGAAIGLMNGAVVTRLGVNAFIATLASGLVVAGVALLVSGGQVTSAQDPTFLELGSTQVLGFAVSTWVFVVWAVLLAVLLARTIYGRYMYASGGNPLAAQLSGVRVASIRTATFVISGMGAAVAGVLAASQSGSVTSNAGTGLELTTIAAVVVGGTSIWGGDGAVWRTVVGVLLLGMIQNGFNLLSINPLYQQIVYGAIILVAAAVDAQARREH
jgi:ribose transport system permease protein